MDASIIAALIGAAAGTANAVGGSYLQAGMNRRQMRYARELANKGLTNSDLQAFMLNQQSAQEARNFALEMDSTNYQRKVADMQAAGVNPALAIGGVLSPPSSNAMATASNTGSGSGIGVQSPDFSSVAALASLGLENKRIKLENKRLEQEYALRSKQLGIEQQNADTAKENAASQSRQASVAERSVSVQEARLSIDKDLAESHIQVNEAQISKMAADVVHINKVVEQLPEYLEIAKKNSNSQALSAAASMQQAEASLQNAVTNSYIADYQTDLYYTNSLLNDLVANEKSEVLKYLPEKLQTEISNMHKEGVLLDKRGYWLDKNGKLMDAQRAKAYVETGIEVTNALTDIVTKFAPVPKIGF